MDTRILSKGTYLFLFSMLGLVYLAGLFVPLMDRDSAHHANIAMHMYLHRDYVNLVDAGQDYLDKPHLLFWLCALSYKIFGITSFAYRFPSLLFTILCVYSVYRLGRSLYNEETGKLAALIIASAFAFILANTDVRMDAVLTACVAFATWQGVDFIRHQKITNAFGLAVGLALGFDTKGHIAVFAPLIGLLFYIIYLRRWKIFLNWKWLIVLAGFAILIFPVVYCFYLQYNLHPEKLVRGKDHINGVRFILFGQTVERLKGESFGNDAKNDYFFFFHSFLWAFVPWSILAYIAIVGRLKHFFKRRDEWLTPATVVTIAIVLTFSGFKLPHYINIIFPAAAVMTASWIMVNSLKPRTTFIIQVVVCLLILLLVGMLNSWAFPVKNFLLILSVILLLAVVFYFLRTQRLSHVQKVLCVSVTSMVFSFFLLNTNFYPQLLKYQGGNELAKKIKGNVDPVNVYFWKNNYSSSFNFYTATERKQFDDSFFLKGKKPIWLLFDKNDLPDIRQSGYKIGLIYSVPDFGITKLNLKFVNPVTRKNELHEMVLGEITGKE
ncbi:MAG TPA: glycosyltransferase family 39 protein [Chitinophagaceae bacterium]|nr:glycosyltransferase family 39 protein [Chitinophagaceae bacterium]